MIQKCLVTVISANSFNIVSDLCSPFLTEINFPPRLASGDYPSAVEHYSSALELSPGDARILSSRAAAFSKLGQWEKCLQVSCQ